MVDRGSYISSALGIALAIAIIFVSIQMYVNMPGKLLSAENSDKGAFYEIPLATSLVEEGDRTAFQIVMYEPSVILVYVKYNPIDKDITPLRFEIINLKLVTQDGDIIYVNRSLYLNNQFILNPGDTELVAVIPIYPTTINAVELTINGEIQTGTTVKKLTNKTYKVATAIELRSSTLYKITIEIRN